MNQNTLQSDPDTSYIPIIGVTSTETSSPIACTYTPPAKTNGVTVTATGTGPTTISITADSPDDPEVSQIQFHNTSSYTLLGAVVQIGTNQNRIFLAADNNVTVTISTSNTITTSIRLLFLNGTTFLYSHDPQVTNSDG